MPPRRTTLLLALILPAAALAPAFAQAPRPAGMLPAEAAARRFPQPVRAGDLVGRDVLRPLESQPVLGRVSGLVRRPDGTVDVVVQYGGVLGFGRHPIAVPVDAMALLGQDIEVLDLTPTQLDALPRFDGAGTVPVPPDTTIQVGLARPSH